MLYGKLTRTLLDPERTVGCFQMFWNDRCWFSAASIEAPMDLPEEYKVHKNIARAIPNGDWICSKQYVKTPGKFSYVVHTLEHLPDAQIHEGINEMNAFGCILLGTNIRRGKLVESRKAMTYFNGGLLYQMSPDFPLYVRCVC